MVSSYNDVHSVPCKHCGITYDLLLDKEDLRKWKDGEGYIQNVLAYLSAGERELLISGTCDNCWTNMYGSDDDDDEDEYESDGDEEECEDYEEEEEEDPRVGAHLKMQEECDTTNPNLAPSAEWCQSCNTQQGFLSHNCSDNKSGILRVNNVASFARDDLGTHYVVELKCSNCNSIFRVDN